MLNSIMMMLNSLKTSAAMAKKPSATVPKKVLVRTVPITYHFIITQFQPSSIFS